MAARRPAPRSLLVGTTVAVIAAGAGLAFPALAGSAPAVPTFSQPMILAGGGAEPSIRVPADGKSQAYVSAPTGLGSNFWRITKTRNADGSVSFNQSPVQQPDLGTGGGDSEISVGDSTQSSGNGCDPIAYSGLHNIDLLDNFTVATSTDCGKTFPVVNPYGTQNTLTDRQWQVFDGAKTNFLIYHKVDTGQIVVSESTDGGETYASLDPDGAHGIIDPTLLAQSGTNQQIGNIIVSHGEPIKGKTNTLSGEQVHAMYAIFGIADDTTTALQSQVPGQQYNGIDDIYVGKSVDGGLTWTDSLVYHVDPSTKRELNMLFPVVSADANGNLYAAWADTFKVQYSVSTDHGAHWSKPFQVNRDNRGTTKTGADAPDPSKADVFPWIGAGRDGLLDVVWYHGQGGSPLANKIYRDPGDPKTAWTVAFAQLGHANRVSAGTANPQVLSYSDAITPVIHYGDVCQNGTFCSLVPVSGAPLSTGDRSLLDFFQVAIDADGRANLAIADNATAPGQNISAYMIQLTGYSLATGKKLTPLKVEPPKLSCDAYGTFTDPQGDGNEFAVAAVPEGNADSLDIRKSWVTWDAAKKVATFHIQVSNLSAITPGATGIVGRFYFGWATKGFDVVAQQDLGDGTSFKLQNTNGAGGLPATIVAGLTGAFDTAHNEIRVDLPAGVFAKSSDPALRVKSLTAGAKLTGLKSETRRSFTQGPAPAGLSPVADSSAGVCPATLGGSGHSSGSVGGSGNAGLLPKAPVAAAGSALRRTAGPIGLALMLGGGAAIASRRREMGGLAVA
jgi:hypothetical protein